jgi:hypothetical protein
MLESDPMSFARSYVRPTSAVPLLKVVLLPIALLSLLSKLEFPPAKIVSLEAQSVN